MSEGKIFAVTGNPILHSRSPEIFQAAFKALGLDNYYYLRFRLFAGRRNCAGDEGDNYLRFQCDLPI